MKHVGPVLITEQQSFQNLDKKLHVLSILSSI